MKTEEQTTPSSSNLAKAQPTTVKTQDVPSIFIFEQKSWMVSRKLIHQSKYSLNIAW